MGLPSLADEARLIATMLEHLLDGTDNEALDAEALGPQDEKEALAFHVAALEMKRLAADISRIAETILVDALAGQRRVTIDGKTVEVRHAYKRTEWEHAKLATHVALRALGGEVVEGMDLVVDAFVKACRPEWRVTALKEMGLSDDEYCSRELGRPSVSIL